MAEGEKTEKATPKKRRDERKKGHVMMSKDVVSVATLAASVLTLRLTITPAVESIGRFINYCVGFVPDRTETFVPKEVPIQAVVVAVRSVGPLFAATILFVIISTMAQTRMLVAFESIKPKFSKLNPISGFKNLFSLKNLVEMLKNLIKISILLYIVYTSLRDMLMVVERYMYAELDGACLHLFDSIFIMLLKVILAFVVIAAADYIYQWWSFEKDMKMTKQEVKEEFKQTEGDPQIKGRIKQLQRQMARSRMMSKVPDADVVIRNPTHVAVALRYHPGEDAAPIVVAKGLDFLALRIVEVAEENNVPVIENRPVARALYAACEVDRMIPPEMYEAVADVMVYLYKINRIKSPEEMRRQMSQSPEERQ